jgi:hypothetical protein
MTVAGISVSCSRISEGDGFLQLGLVIESTS